MKGTKAVLLICAALLALGTVAYAVESSYIYSLHDPGGEYLMANKGKKGWIVWTEAIGHNPGDYSGKNFSAWSNAGYGVIVRLNNGYGGSGNLPYQSEYDNFAQRVQNYVAASPGVDYWIIGNETNLPREWPGNINADPNTGEPITSARYISCYIKCWNKIKAINSSIKVCPSPSGTWAPPYWQQGVEEFDDYWVNCLNGIGSYRIDGLIIHTYTHGCDPALITSDQKMGPPYTDIYYHFKAYKNYMWRIPSTMTTKPVFITESDQNTECASGGYTWNNANTGWVREAYAEINRWNLYNSQKIRCLTLFRWPDVWEGPWNFSISTRGGVIDDFNQALDYGYTWGTPAPPPPPDDGMNNNTPTGTNVALTASQASTDSSYSSSYNGSKAKDGSLGTKWCSTASSSTHWLAYDLGANYTINGYIVRHASAGGETTIYNTQQFKIQSASSLSGPWTDETVVDNSAQAGVTTRSYDNPKTLRYVRLYITDAGIDNYARIPEFEVYATTGGGGSELVVNGGFENGFTNGVPNGWGTWHSSWSNTITYMDEVNTKYSGSHSARWGRDDAARFHGGLYQAVNTSSGVTYDLSAMMRFVTSDPGTWLEVGYDLTGQTSDAEASSVNYTKLESGGQNTWLPYNATFTATGSTVSIFLKYGQYNQVGSGYIWAVADDVSMHVH